MNSRCPTSSLVVRPRSSLLHLVGRSTSSSVVFCRRPLSVVHRCPLSFRFFRNGKVRISIDSELATIVKKSKVREYVELHSVKSSTKSICLFLDEGLFWGSKVSFPKHWSTTTFLKHKVGISRSSGLSTIVRSQRSKVISKFTLANHPQSRFTISGRRVFQCAQRYDHIDGLGQRRSRREAGVHSRSRSHSSHGVLICDRKLEMAGRGVLICDRKLRMAGDRRWSLRRHSAPDLPLRHGHAELDSQAEAGRRRERSLIV